MAEMQIETRFPSRCKACGRDVAVGTSVLWEKGSGVRCAPACEPIDPQTSLEFQETPGTPYRVIGHLTPESARNVSRALAEGADQAGLFEPPLEALMAASRTETSPVYARGLRFPRVLAAMRRAPKARLRLAHVAPAGQVEWFVAGVTSQRAREPGTVYVVRKSDRRWLGRIGLDGAWLAERRADIEKDVELAEELLGRLEADFAGTVAEMGKRLGACMICGHELTDPRSLTVGYGPTCADRYGLPWGRHEAIPATGPMVANPNDEMCPEDFA